MVSPGWSSATIAAAFAWAPECGCTLANSAAEQGLDPIDGQLLDDVDVLAAAVVAASRIALGVLVGQHRALGLHHRDRSEVLRGDHLQRSLLAPQLRADGRMHLGVRLRQRARQHVNHVSSSSTPTSWYVTNISTADE